ncbi:hypothetical protein L195_g044677 [Trifolium pratense]|uniref:Uncharacterized protein n=1 Tax=Trifolium pratense TaxID=57577 RepID=A0A2K3MCP7_TRIPR|nr:hypothetical protein L195_g044677 [Trifolium pratense]
MVVEKRLESHDEQEMLIIPMSGVMMRWASRPLTGVASSWAAPSLDPARRSKRRISSVIES